MNRPWAGYSSKASGASARMHARTASEHLTPFPISQLRSYSLENKTGSGCYGIQIPWSAFADAVPRLRTCGVSIYVPTQKDNDILMEIGTGPQSVVDLSLSCWRRLREVLALPLGCRSGWSTPEAFCLTKRRRLRIVRFLAGMHGQGVCANCSTSVIDFPIFCIWRCRAPRDVPKLDPTD